MNVGHDGSVVLDGDELIIAEVHECLTYADNTSSMDAYLRLRGLDIPVALRPSTPFLDDIFRDTDFRDWLMHR